MADPFIGEIRIFGFNYAPYQWASCGGQIMPLQQNTALYALIGTVFGGDGRTTFQLPNLAGRMLAGAGNGPGLTPRDPGETFGENSVALQSVEMPQHNHVVPVYSDGTRSYMPTATSALSTSDASTMYAFSPPVTGMYPTTSTGGSLPHENRPPLLAMNACISLDGLFPAFQ